jgi:hypothetical protein
MQIKRFDQYKGEVSVNKKRYPKVNEAYSHIIDHDLDPDAHLNEGFLGTILGSLGGGFRDTLVSYFVDWGLEKMGAGDGYDENNQPTFIRQILQNAAESIEISEITSYFKSGSCKRWAKLFQDAILKTLTEDFIRRMLIGAGLKIDLKTGIGSTIVKTLLNSISNAITETEFVVSLEEFLSDKVCNVKFGDLLKGVSGGEKEKISDAAEEYAMANPEKAPKLMDKFGISSLFN